MNGRFITFEGIDGSGKSTQMRLVAEELRRNGFDVVETCEPGGTELGRRLRSVFLETEETVEPLAELLLFAADRAQHVEHLIKPALNAGKVVLSDRYADATFAYQGFGRGFQEDVIRRMIELATGGLQPGLTLFFDISIENAVERMNARADSGQKANRMDAETAEFYTRVREGYRTLAEREPQRIRMIDANGGIEEINAAAIDAVKRFLK